MLLVVLGLVAAVVALLVGIASFFFSDLPIMVRELRGISYDDHMHNLESRGKARRDHYEAKGAISAHDYTTSSIVHFLDVGQRGILCLRGQHYLDFEPIDDDPELNQARQFPTRTFSVLRNARTNDALDLTPGPEVFEPIHGDPIVRLTPLIELGFACKDGEVVTGVSLQDLEGALAAASKPK